MICKVCGKEYESNESPYYDKTLICSSRCFNANFWQERVENKDKYIICDGQCYYDGGITTNTKTKWNGFSGKLFYIQTLDKMPKVFKTNNLFYNGVIPNEFREELQDNVKFITQEKYEQKIETIVSDIASMSNYRILIVSTSNVFVDKVNNTLMHLLCSCDIEVVKYAHQWGKSQLYFNNGTYASSINPYDSSRGVRANIIICDNKIQDKVLKERIYPCLIRHINSSGEYTNSFMGVIKMFEGLEEVDIDDIFDCR